MNVTVEALRRISATLFDRLESLGHSQVEIREDYYWEVDRAQRHNLDVDPENPRVERLTEDWSSLEQLLSDERVRLTSGFVFLGSILRAVGETLAD